MDTVRSTKPFPLVLLPLPPPLAKPGRGGGDVALAARVAIGGGSMSDEYLGRGMPYGTTNPS